MKKLLPVFLAMFGIGAGIAAGVVLKPDLPADTVALEEGNPCGQIPTEPESIFESISYRDPANQEYVKMNNQFIIPVVVEERVRALVILSLSVDIEKGHSQTVFDREPKLRDAFLQVLFNHANIGGFQGSFTENANMAILRRALKDAGQSVLGKVVNDVLITDLARQDV
ncbi:flagellar basal body-associated FliL family protein [Seohaeicola saemankumensis]|uniref:flagellar basal body-associated FliL family protein n=1 Tax=Seohaeicola saemankumensis TaxID=481181 RepID=UPI001E532484|nr:flagellar basal body-associated FliL family protein [Seohaeicola saemankumensis]MCD1625038.1 flagellar basal body-associated FliL family protein [Seohaeicola saemankumensis]